MEVILLWNRTAWNVDEACAVPMRVLAFRCGDWTIAAGNRSPRKKTKVKFGDEAAVVPGPQVLQWVGVVADGGLPGSVAVPKESIMVNCEIKETLS